MTYRKRKGAVAVILGVSFLGFLGQHSWVSYLSSEQYLNEAIARETPLQRKMSEKKVAQVLIDHMKRFPKSESRRLAKHIVALCEKHQFDPAFILALIDAESSFKKDVVSYAGAVGLMQLMPATAHLVASQHKIKYKGARSLKDPFTNVSLGIAYIAYLRDRYKNDTPYFHIAAYNLGPSKLDQLRKRVDFKPDKTKVYYEKIKSGTSRLRFYPDSTESNPEAVRTAKGRKRV